MAMLIGKMTVDTDWRLYVLLSLALVFSSTIVKAADAKPSCATGLSDFERPQTLRSAVIIGTEGSRIPLYKKHPTECSGADATVCRGKAYLVPGDRVEVASACGGYARVRYVNNSRISTGWVQEIALRDEGTASSPSARNDFLSQIEGYYEAPGRDCSSFEGGKEVPCDPPSTDCLRIRKIDDQHAKFDVYSVQRNRSQCEVEGVADFRDGTLNYVERDPREMAAGDRLIIHFDKGQIAFEVVPGPNEVPGTISSFCGAQASLLNVHFLLKDKGLVDFGTCGSVEKF
jgi:hypothetical protein